MNFFNIGFVLMSLHLNLDSELNYILKLLGILFMFGGITEISLTDKGFGRLRGYLLLTAALSAGGLAGSLLARFSVIGTFAANIWAIIFGVSSTAAALYSQYLLCVKLMLPRHELVNDPSLLSALAHKWKIMAFFAALCMVCDTLNRLLPQGNGQVLAGTVLLGAKLIMLIYVCLVGAAFNRVRMDFNVMHPV
jgi:hypothetical protein